MLILINFLMESAYEKLKWDIEEKWDEIEKQQLKIWRIQWDNMIKNEEIHRVMGKIDLVSQQVKVQEEMQKKTGKPEETAPGPKIFQ